MRQIRAVRGATTAERDEREEILSVTRELLTEILLTNKIMAEDLVSAFFTVTPDLTAAFPAEAARQLGLTEISAIGAVEMAVHGAPKYCIRVLIHFYTEKTIKEVHHVYQREARNLRPDRV